MSRGARRTGILVVGLAAAACSVDQPVGRVERCALGAHSIPRDGQDAAGAIAAFEALIDQPVVFDRQYYALDEDVPGAYERATAAAGRIPFFSVAGTRVAGDPLTWAQIADPDDARATAILTGFGERLRDFGGPVYVIFHDQPNNDAGAPEEYAAAWRRVVDVARAAGADRAVWVWSLSSSAYPELAEAYYPGDDHVDWIGVTGFNYYDGTPSSAWRTFSSVFASFYEWARPRGKPLFITSTASSENLNAGPEAPKSKAVWLRQAITTLEGWPEIQAMSWYHGVGANELQNWAADSSPEALAAFRELADAPHFDVSGATPSD